MSSSQQVIIDLTHKKMALKHQAISIYSADI